jgi:hypothetical protein
VDKKMAVSVAVCAAGGGIPTVSGKSSTGYICDGGDHTGKEVTAIIEGPHTPQAIGKAIEQEIANLKHPLGRTEKKP